MSARREKRFRQLECRVAALEKRAYRESVAKVAREINEVLEARDADWAPAPPKRGFWRRLLNTITGRDET